MNEVREALRRAETALALVTTSHAIEGVERDELDRLLQELVHYLRIALAKTGNA